MIKTQQETLAPPEFKNGNGEIIATIITYLATDKSELYRNEKIELTTQIKIARDYNRAGNSSNWILDYLKEQS